MRVSGGIRSRPRNEEVPEKVAERGAAGSVQKLTFMHGGREWGFCSRGRMFLGWGFPETLANMEVVFEMGIMRRVKKWFNRRNR